MSKDYYKIFFDYENPLETDLLNRVPLGESQLKIFFDKAKIFFKDDLSQALSDFLAVAAKNSNVKCCEAFLKAGALANKAFNSDIPALMWSVYNEDYDISKILVESGADVNIISKDSCSPLSIAISKGNLELCKLLLSHKADPNVTFSRTDRTPFLIAVEFGNKDICMELMKNGADINKWGIYFRGISYPLKYFPIDVAFDNGHIELGNYLAEHGAAIDLPYKGDKRFFGKQLVENLERVKQEREGREKIEGPRCLIIQRDFPDDIDFF